MKILMSLILTLTIYPGPYGYGAIGADDKNWGHIHWGQCSGQETAMGYKNGVRWRNQGHDGPILSEACLKHTADNASIIYAEYCRETKLTLLGYENEKEIRSLDDVEGWSSRQWGIENPDGESFEGIHEVKCFREYSTDKTIVFFYAESNTSSSVRDCGINWPQEKIYVRSYLSADPWVPTPLPDCLERAQKNLNHYKGT